jgi:hypothetical protein
MDALKKDYDHQKAGGKSSLQFDAQKMDEEIDVVGLDRSSDDLLTLEDEDDEDEQAATDLHKDLLAAAQQVVRKKVTTFSIESLLNSRVQQEERLMREKSELGDIDVADNEDDDEASHSSCPPASPTPQSFRPSRTSSPSNRSNNNLEIFQADWHQPEKTDMEVSRLSEQPNKPHIHKPSPTFAPLLRGPPGFSQPALNFLAAANAAVNAATLASNAAAHHQHHVGSGDGDSQLSNFLQNSSPPSHQIGSFGFGRSPPPSQN